MTKVKTYIQRLIMIAAFAAITLPNSFAADHASFEKSTKAERNFIRSGNKAMESEKYHEALEDYERALDVNPLSLRANYNKARALLELSSDDNKGTRNDPRAAADSILQRVAEQAKKFDTEVAAKAFYNLGNMAFNDQNYDRSIDMYKKSLRIEPENMQTRENLRLAQLKKQEQEQQEQNQDKQDQKQDQQQEQQQNQDQQQDQQQQHEQQQQQEQQQMTGSAQQILQSMQNKENRTRKKVNAQEQPSGRPQHEKPW